MRARADERACAHPCCSVRVSRCGIFSLSSLAALFPLEVPLPQRDRNSGQTFYLSFVIYFFYVYLFLSASAISAAPMFDLKCREVTRPIVGEALIIKGERGNLFT